MGTSGILGENEVVHKIIWCDVYNVRKGLIFELWGIPMSKGAKKRITGKEVAKLEN